VKESNNKHKEKLEKKVGLELELEPLFILALRIFLGLMMAPMFFFPLLIAYTPNLNIHVHPFQIHIWAEI